MGQVGNDFVCVYVCVFVYLCLLTVPRLVKGSLVWLIPISHERVGVQVNCEILENTCHT